MTVATPASMVAAPAPTAAAIAIAINPVNDAPTLSMPSGTKYITDGSFEFIGVGNTISFNDAADLSNATRRLRTRHLRQLHHHPQRQARAQPTTAPSRWARPSASASPAAPATWFSPAARPTCWPHLPPSAYTPTDTNVNGAITFRVTVDDGNNGGTQLPSGVTGPTSATNTFTLITTDQNEAPSIAGLDAVSPTLYSRRGCRHRGRRQRHPDRPGTRHLPELERGRPAHRT
jgi:hypothetical protein